MAILLAIGSLASGLDGTKVMTELDDVFQEGKRLFFSELKLKFGLHPSKFNLRPESIKKIQDAEKEIPFLYENLINFLFIKDSPHLQALIENADRESTDRFRERFLRLSLEAADRFVQSLFQEKSRTVGIEKRTPITDKARLDLILRSISDEDSLKRTENGGLFAKLDSFEFFNQWGFQITRFREAHKSTKGKGVRVAIIDSGISKKSKLIENANIDPEFNFCLINRKRAPWKDEKLPVHDENGHGTVTASLIVAAAPEAEIHIYKIGNDLDPVFPYWKAYQVAGAIYKAVFNQADVIMVSMVFDKDFEFLKDACQFAYESNVIIVCPNGTSSRVAPGRAHQFPAHYNTTVAVAGVVPGPMNTPVLWKKSVSSHYTSVSAPAAVGDDRITPDNSWAAAVTAGLVALISSRIPKSKRELRGQYFQRVYEVLTKSAQPQVLGYRSFNPIMGYGLINAELSVNEVLESYLEKMKTIEANFQKRLEERIKQDEERKKKSSKKKQFDP